jgi:hypothetical protein
VANFTSFFFFLPVVIFPIFILFFAFLFSLFFDLFLLVRWFLLGVSLRAESAG